MEVFNLETLFCDLLKWDVMSYLGLCKDFSPFFKDFFFSKINRQQR